MRAIKLMLRNLGEKIGTFAYTKAQIHHLKYMAIVPGGVGTFLVPLPIDTHSQKIHNIKLSVQPQNYIKGDTYNMALFSLAKTKDDKVEIVFNAEVAPVVYRKKADFNVSNYKGSFVVKNAHANSEDKEIIELANKLAGGEQKLMPLMKKLYEYTVTKLNYGDSIDGLYSYKDALTRDKVDCGGFCMLLSSLLGVFHIPHYLAVGYLIGWGKEKKLSQHVWLEAVMPDGSIFPLDPSEDKRRRLGESSRWGGFGYMGSDRVVFSYGNDVEIMVKGKKIVTPLIQHPIIFE